MQDDLGTDVGQSHLAQEFIGHSDKMCQVAAMASVSSMDPKSKPLVHLPHLLFLSLSLHNQAHLTVQLASFLTFVFEVVSDSSETIEVIIIKLGTVTASDMRMHHVLSILTMTFVQGHTSKS